MGYYDEYGEWVEEEGDEGNPEQDILAILTMLAGGAPTSAGKPYKGTDPFYYEDQSSQNLKNYYSLLGINPIESMFPMGEKGTVPYQPTASYYHNTTDPEAKAIYDDIDAGASLAQIEQGLAGDEFNDEERKTYLELAKQYESASRKDYTQQAVDEQTRRYTDPFGEEDNPEYVALRQQFPTDADYGKKMFTDRFNVSEEAYTYDPIRETKWVDRERELPRLPHEPGAPQKSRHIRKYKEPVTTTVGHRKVRDPYTENLNRKFNERVNAIAKFTSREFGGMMRQMPRRVPTPGARNFQDRQRAIAALLGLSR